MTIGVLLVTHQPLGQAMLDICVNTLNACPLATRVLDVPRDCDPELAAEDADALLAELNTGDGVLVLTDLCGSTPSNIACRLHGRPDIIVVSGLNLPMLMRVLNYPELSLTEMAERAIDGGQQGVSQLTSCDF